MIKVDKGGGVVKNVWILVDVNKERSLSPILKEPNSDCSLSWLAGSSIYICYN